MAKFKKYTVAELRKKQEQLDKRKKHVLFEGKNNPIDLAKIIHRFFFEKKETVFSEDEMQCYAGRSRTIDDAYLVAKNYIPEITYEQVYNAVTKLYTVDDNSEGLNLLQPRYCSQIRRRVHDPYITGKESTDIRNAIGGLNVKCPNYINAKNKAKKSS